MGPGTSKLLVCVIVDAGTGLAVGLGFCVVTSATGFELLSVFVVDGLESMGRTTKKIAAASIAPTTIPTIITLFLDGGDFRSVNSGAGETAGFGGLVATRSGDSGAGETAGFGGLVATRSGNSGAGETVGFGGLVATRSVNSGAGETAGFGGLVATRSGDSGAGETAGFGGLVATRSGDAGIVSDFRVIIVEPVGVPQISQNFASIWSIAPQIWQTGGGSIFAPQTSQNLLSKESGWLQSGQ